VKTMKAGLVCAALCAAFAPAAAQAQTTWTDQGFVNVSAGIQAGSSTLATATTFDIYSEAGTIQTSQEIEGGAVFDISAGYKIRRNFALGVAYSRSSSGTDALLTASVPDPLFFDRPRPVSASVDDLNHTENAFHLMAVWVMPVTEAIDVAFSAGPTIFNVSQELPGSLTVSEPGPTVAGVDVISESETAVGINLGVDVTYMLTPRFGVGGLARYTLGSVDFEGADDSITLGGFQIGGGLRVRF
jgi:Outer membrane protein beta-barrel domain